MQKIERDGMVAVLYSPGFGSGWSTWNTEFQETLCMDAEIVQSVLDGNIGKAVKIAKKKCPGIYCGGAEDLKVYWIEKGHQFEIEEYDGAESIHVIGGRGYMTA